MTDETGYHYHVIRRALDVIDRGGPHLSLEQLASEMGMSPAHFQRVFSSWVGVSPKKYQQYLTLEHAKSLLADRFTTLEPQARLGCLEAVACMIFSLDGRR